MQDFNVFITLMLTNLSTFLMAPPMVYFIGLAIIAIMAKILGSIIRSATR